MVEARNIVFLGASYAGLSAAHYFLKHVLPALPKDGQPYHVYLVNPSTEFYHRIGAPRAVASSELMPNSKVFVEISPGFKKYSSKIFTFVHGKAVDMNTHSRTVTIRKMGGGEQVIPYYALMLATGTRSVEKTLSDQGLGQDQIKTDLAAMRQQLKNAKSIVVAGGGPAGVETAGDIGEVLNGVPGWFGSRPSNPQAKITLVTSADKLLPVLRPAIAKQAEVLLERVGVEVQYNAKVESTDKTSSGKTRVSLSNGKTLECDVYIPAIGVVPMTEYVPKTLLTDKGYVKTNGKTLRVDEAGPRVYAVGDCGSYTRGGVLDIMDAIPAVMRNVKRDLLAAHANPNAKPKGPDREYVAYTAESQLVPVGTSKGVGAFNGNKLPSIMVWMIKGKDYMSSKAVENVTGKRWEKETGWKPTDG